MLMLKKLSFGEKGLLNISRAEGKIALLSKIC